VVDTNKVLKHGGNAGATTTLAGAVAVLLTPLVAKLGPEYQTPVATAAIVVVVNTLIEMARNAWKHRGAR
jgi:hypothetical protein